MKKILICTSIPKHGGYFGGIAFIVNEYLQKLDLFKKNGFEIDLFNFEDVTIDVSKQKKIMRKATNLLNAVFQFLSLKNKLKIDNDYNLHFHTSRKWTFFKDLMIINKISKHVKGEIYLSIHFADIELILPKNEILRKICLNTMNSKLKKVILLSKKTQEEFIEWGLEESKTSVLYTFHNMEYRKAEKEKMNLISDGLNTDTIRLLFVGSIDKRKGVLDLLDAVNNLKNENIFLDICGKITDIEIEKDYKLLCKQLNTKVKIHGYVSGENKNKIFNKADVLVLPSYGEGMPIVIMEAMASGCSIVSTNVGGIPEIVKTNHNGILYSPGNINELMNAIKLMLNEDFLIKTKRNNISESKKYTLENNINAICSIYDESKCVVDNR